MSFPDSLRKTKSRLKVWEILSSSTTPLTARQIAQKADGGNEEKAVWLSSVYRALEAFEKAQAVNRTLLKDSPEALYSLSETGHHHYAICMNCKSRTELEGCPFGEHEHLHTVDEDFMVVGHVVEVFGYCKDCRKKMQKDAKK
ncbi:MAG: transcriptional repressor [Clostridiales bacterium]|nr:transcriptional repressor [Clostridiales bacterium]MBQ5968316.1 transcriptional repressor [Clostridiales bacterium]MBQ6270900.1 transcriptional repressor [Clostridiales bacterium]MCR5057098.1 transcriptional repressor [Clostridiales bacterium]